MQDVEHGSQTGILGPAKNWPLLTSKIEKITKNKNYLSDQSKTTGHARCVLPSKSEEKQSCFGKNCYTAIPKTDFWLHP